MTLYDTIWLFWFRFFCFNLNPFLDAKQGLYSLWLLVVQDKSYRLKLMKNMELYVVQYLRLWSVHSINQCHWILWAESECNIYSNLHVKSLGYNVNGESACYLSALAFNNKLNIGHSWNGPHASVVVIKPSMIVTNHLKSEFNFQHLIWLRHWIFLSKLFCSP